MKQAMDYSDLKMNMIIFEMKEPVWVVQIIEVGYLHQIHGPLKKNAELIVPMKDGTQINVICIHNAKMIGGNSEMHP
jgi:hypothetical protein